MQIVICNDWPGASYGVGHSPSLQAMIIGPMVPLSRSRAKYISFFSFILFAMYSVLTGFPAGPVCFVTRVCTAPGTHSHMHSQDTLHRVCYKCAWASLLSLRHTAHPGPTTTKISGVVLCSTGIK